MTELMTDGELLREYAQRASAPAFQSLVGRHTDLVFATALRGTSDAGAARELTQNVFITLARKAARLQCEASVAGWLHKTALHEIRHWWRGELRRRRREQTAVELGTTMNNEDSLLTALAAEIDEGLLALGGKEREALMLRYFEGRSHREIGALLGAREDAVRMRITKALDRLTQFFRKRGYAVPAAATTAAVLGGSAKAAPAGFALMAANSALTAGGAGAATGFKLAWIKFMGLTKTQTALVAAVIAAGPIAWEWNAGRVSLRQSALIQSNLETVRGGQEESSAELDRLRAEAARLDAALAGVAANESRYEAAAGKLDLLKARLHGLLTDAHSRWPDDLPYTRVHKSTVKSLDILSRPPTTFGPSGALTPQALEMFGITADEKAPVEQALANYWQGVRKMSAANAYETNSTDPQTGRLTKTVTVPPLGQPLKDLGADTAAQLTTVLGADREQLVFGGWAQGGIQIFSPGNLWNISEQPQTFTAWVEPGGVDGGGPRYGAGWHSLGSGTSGEGPYSVNILPEAILARFINPWLEQNGVTNLVSQ
jgi:RNA polymerase sigma factor (sigma-70 family)